MHRNLKFLAQAVSRKASILVIALAMAGTAAAQAVLVPPQVGPYGFVINTTSTVPLSQGGVAVLGVANFDGVGNISGTYTLELGTGGQGGPQKPVTVTGSLSGTYFPDPNPDPNTDPNAPYNWKTIMTLDLGAFGQVTGTFVMVVDNHGRGLQLALSGCVGPICDLTGNVVSGVGQAQFNGAAHPMHAGLLNGSYGMQSTKSSPSPQASVERWTFDGMGGVTMSGAYVGPPTDPVNHPNVPNAGYGTLTGTYTVYADGTGLITIPAVQGVQNHKSFAFVITNSHSGILALQLDRAGDGVLYEVGQIQ
jgi:hypothetical protein